MTAIRQLSRQLPSPKLFSVLIVLTMALIVGGCSGQSTREASSRTDSVKSESGGREFKSLDLQGGINGLAVTTAKQKNAADNRKIIYTAKISIVVESFDLVESKIKNLVTQYGGYIADANLGRMQGKKRTGTWTIRVPVENFEALLDSAGDIGLPTSRSQDSQDVTEEFVDLQARISNKKKLEARIIQLLDRPEDKIQHVIEVERELARVREDIERMEGRLRFLTDRVALTTVTITVVEEKEYTPPEAPTYSNRIAKAWSNSLENAQRFFADTSVFIVANAMPLLAWIVVLTIGWMCWRRHLKKRRREQNA